MKSSRSAPDWLNKVKAGDGCGRREGGRLIWSGRVDSQVIGNTDEHFDMIALVEYPSRPEFLRIAGDPRVAEYSVQRTARLEMQWLIATTTQWLAPSDPGDGDSSDNP